MPIHAPNKDKIENGVWPNAGGCCNRRVASWILLGPLTSRALAEPAERQEINLLPIEVAGVPIPSSTIAKKAAALSRKSCPGYLFNHCMRTFLFGALAMRRQKFSYDAELSFVGASFHDLGLLPAFASQDGSFEIDGADAAEKFAMDSGLSPRAANAIWHSVALHDGRFALTRRSGPEAMLVALGAGSDVVGPQLDTDDERRQVAEVLAAFPRLQFKKNFTSLLIDHCNRKPLSQRGTWLEGLCREQVPSAWGQTVQEGIAKAPFPE